MISNVVMATKKPKDGHKPSRMVRIKEVLASLLDEIVDENATDFTAEVTRAVRELLERAGKWPQKK